jgi:hypothetical protein
MAAPLPSKWKDDHTLIYYCILHCRSERALFHREDVNRMLTLAGHPDMECVQEWVSMHEEMRKLCELALKRLREQELAQKEEEARRGAAEERRQQEERLLAAMDHLFPE